MRGRGGGAQNSNRRNAPDRRGPANNRGRRDRRSEPRANAQPANPFSGPPVIATLAPASLPPQSIAVVWFRNDLRVRDNAALALANTASVVVPMYTFDLSKYGQHNASPWGFQRTSRFKALFQIQAVRDIRARLTARGGGMIARQGDPVEEVLDVAKELATRVGRPIHVVVHKETAWEETHQQRRVEKGLAELAQQHAVEMKLHCVWGSTLHHIDDLPFNAGGPGVPETFTSYRKLIEAGDSIPVRPEIKMPVTFKPFPHNLKLREDPPPSLVNDLQMQEACDPHTNAHLPPHPKSVIDFTGGETKAEERLTEYFWETKALEHYKQTRNESGKRNCSSKFSAWLAHGCISPRTIYWKIKSFEERIVANEDTYWLVFELMTRDYFYWVAASVGPKLFALNGYSGRSAGERSIWNIDPAAVKQVHRERLEKWCAGQTGAPLVDANMREMAATGYMSNRGRQNVASFLIHDLEFPDWRAGAEYFESVLVDHDVAANWANWAYLAGVGSDPRGGRKFNVVKQAMQYDPDGWFVRLWCPELALIPAPAIHEPHRLNDKELDEFGITRGQTYPVPIVKLARAPPSKNRR